MSKNPNIDLYRHLSFAAVGGFFGAYAILCRCGILASAQTMNLLELTISALRGDGYAVLLHLGALALYVVGTMLTVLLPHYLHIDMHLAVPVIDFAACVVLCFIPADANAVPALYPIFFAMSGSGAPFPARRALSAQRYFQQTTPNRPRLPLQSTSPTATGGTSKRCGFMCLPCLPSISARP